MTMAEVQASEIAGWRLRAEGKAYPCRTARHPSRTWAIPHHAVAVAGTADQLAADLR